MTSIHIPLPDMDLNGDGKVTINELVMSAFLIAASIVLGANVVNGVVVGGLYLIKPWENWNDARAWLLIIFLLSLGTGTGVGVYFTIKRMLRYERGEREAMTDLEHQRKVKKWEFDVARGADQKATDTQGDGATQDHYARLFLKYSYDMGHFITRREWTKAGLSEDWWNRLNSLMKKYNIRQGASTELQQDTFSEAWGVWCDAMVKGRHWVKHGSDYLKD